MDRHALVSRHNPVNTRLDTRSPLTVGNGEFAFTADITGLQSSPDRYLRGIPLCTQAQWGWHTTPIPAGLHRDDFRLKMYDVNGRRVGYKTSADGQEELFRYLRENPHRLHLGRIDLRMQMADGREADADDIRAVQCAGSHPPQETGLTCNSWYGKFHLEMHWWHAAHFPAWGRAPLLLAVAMMAAGWENGPGEHAPGFPTQSWTVQAEGLHAML